MARTSKKRARELRQDKFRDATMRGFDRLGDRLEGRRRTILYAVAGVAALALLFGLWSWRSNRRDAEARAALGRAIETSQAQVTASPAAGTTAKTFPSERERAQQALKEFQEVADKYGDPHEDIARYMAATQLLVVERSQGLSELEQLGKGGGDLAARAKFALALAREADGQHDAAATLYRELLDGKDSRIPADTLNLRLANVLERQGRKDEAVNLLFELVKRAREAKGRDGQPAPQTQAARDAAEKLRSLDPARYEQLPKEAPPAPGALPF